MSFIDYSNINSLEKTVFIAGTSFTLEFVAYQSDGLTLLDLGGATVEWGMFPYGNDSYTALQKTGTITGTNTYEVSLIAADTISLPGTYIHQPVITSFSGETYRPAQGVLIILPAVLIS